MNAVDAKPEKYAAILAAASEIFSESGFAKTRIEDIASRANVGKGTVYEYFPSKEHLLLQCCIGLCQNNEAKITAATLPENTDPADIDFLAMLHQLVRNIAETVLNSGRKELRLFIQLWEVADKAPELAKEVNTTIQALYQRWEGMLGQLYQAGLAKQAYRKVPQPAFIGHLLTSAIDGWIWQKTFRSELQVDALAKGLADHIVAYLRPEGSC